MGCSFFRSGPLERDTRACPLFFCFEGRAKKTTNVSWLPLRMSTRVWTHPETLCKASTPALTRDPLHTHTHAHREPEALCFPCGPHSIDLSLRPISLDFKGCA